MLRCLWVAALLPVAETSPAATIPYSFTSFGVAGALIVHPTGINDSGQVVGWYTQVGSSLLESGFLRTSGGQFTTVVVPGSPFTYLTSINNEGIAVGSAGVGNASSEGIQVSNGGIGTFRLDGLDQTEPISIDDSGRMLVEAYSQPGPAAYYLRSPDGLTYTPLRFPSNASPGGLSPNGQLLVGTTGGQPFLESLASGAIQQFTVSSVARVTASGINDAGAIVGYTNGYRGVQSQQAFVIQPDGTVQTLVFPAASNTVAFGISGNGTIVGEYSGDSGSGAFIAQPESAAVPEPISAGLLTLIAAAFVAVRVRSRKESHRCGQMLRRLWIVPLFLLAGTAPAANIPYSFTSFTVGTSIHPTGINDSGQIVGWYTQDTSSHRLGFLRTADGQLTTIHVPGSYDTELLSINNAGVAVGFADLPTGAEAIQVSNGAVGTVQMNGLQATQAISIDDSGRMLVFAASSQPGSAGLYLRSADGLTATPLPLTKDGYVSGLSPNGQFLVGSIGDQPFVESLVSGAIQQFDVPAGYGVHSSAMNDAGSVVGYTIAYRGIPFPQDGFVLGPDGTSQMVAFPGAGSTIAFGINDEGAIVGEYGGGEEHGPYGFIAEPEFATVPEPHFAALVALFTGALWAAARRRSRPTRY